MPKPLKTLTSGLLLLALSLACAARAGGRDGRNKPASQSESKAGPAKPAGRHAPGRATKTSQMTSRPQIEKMSGIVESVDLEKGVVFVSLGAPETAHLMARSAALRAAWEAEVARREASWHGLAGDVAGRRAAREQLIGEGWRDGVVIRVRISDETKLKVEAELHGTLMPVRKGAPVEVEGSFSQAESSGAEDLVMQAARITIQTACVPNMCLKSGSCKRKCGVHPCKCAK